MPLNRRNFIAGIGAVAGVGMMNPSLSNVAMAAAPKAKGQVPGVYRTKVGGVQVTSIFDGGMEMGAGIVLDPKMSEINQLKRKAFIQTDHIPGYLNTFVVNTGSKLVLIDTGGADYGPGTGHLLENLNAAGYQPSDIDEILMTHAHPDHVKGLTDKTGQPVFKKAVIRISSPEMDFWFSDEEKSARSGAAAAFDAARTNLTPYKLTGQIETFKPGDDIFSGVTSVDLKGHTPGHCGFRITDGAEQLLIWGDIVHMQALQFTHPEWSLTFDIDPKEAIKSRARILDEVSSDRIRIGGMHLSFPGLGHVESSKLGYALVPQMWESEV